MKKLKKTNLNMKKWSKLLDRLYDAVLDVYLDDLKQVARRDPFLTVDTLLQMEKQQDKLVNLIPHRQDISYRMIRKVFDALHSGAFSDLYNYDSRVGSAIQAIEDQWFADHPEENF